MSDNKLTFTINIDGNAYEGFTLLDKKARQMEESVKKSIKPFDGFALVALKFNQLSESLQNASQSLQDIYQPGIQLDTSLKDLSAITGETGESLRQIEQYARQTAKTFGGSAAQSVESYKLLLSQLNPEIAKSPKALKEMGDSIAVLSKTMGGDTTAAAEVLTTAMNQFQVSMQDPTKAAAEMSRMMNVMAAAAKQGSAELPQIKLALENAGMAAKTAGVSFEETNAAIQVLDKAGKRGAEGGVALRNVMMILSRGRFLPPQVQQELQAAGVDMDILTDKTLSMTERLRPLRAVMSDTALITKMFGMENANAAIALLSGLDEVDRYSQAITGTNTAMEQAKTVMESYAERQARIQACFDNLKISVFNATGDFGIWIQTVASAAIPIAQLTPLIVGIGSVVKTMKEKIMASVGAFKTMRTQLQMMRQDIRKCEMTNLGFTRNIVRATMAVGRFATVGIAGAVKGMINLVRSFVTTGAASAKFAAVSKISFGTFALTAKAACKAVGMALKSIPFIGWAAAAIGVVIAVIRKIRKMKESVDDVSESMESAKNAATDYYTQERLELDTLFSKLEKTNPKSEERNRLVQQLKEMYPDLNEQILEEITNTNNLSIAYDQLINRIAANARIKAKESILQTYYKEMYDYEQQIDDVVEQRLSEPLNVGRPRSEVRKDVEEEIIQSGKTGVTLAGKDNTYIWDKGITDRWKELNGKINSVLQSIAVDTGEKQSPDQQYPWRISSDNTSVTNTTDNYHTQTNITTNNNFTASTVTPTDYSDTVSNLQNSIDNIAKIIIPAIDGYNVTDNTVHNTNNIVNKAGDVTNNKNEKTSINNSISTDNSQVNEASNYSVTAPSTVQNNNYGAILSLILHGVDTLVSRISDIAGRLSYPSDISNSINTTNNETNTTINTSNSETSNNETFISKASNSDVLSGINRIIDGVNTIIGSNATGIIDTLDNKPVVVDDASDSSSVTNDANKINHVNITFGNLLGQNTNVFSSSDDDPSSAGNFMDKLYEALKTVIEDSTQII